MAQGASGCDNTKQMAQRDAALEAFDGLRVRVVKAWSSDTPSTFLARFQSAAARLEPDERIKLEVHTPENTLESVKAVLCDPQASKICALHWVYDGDEDVDSVIPLLIDNCPELALLHMGFRRHSAFDFVSSVLEHPRSKVKVLEMPPYKKGDLPRFFAALGQSQVSALTLYITGIAQGLCEYLAKDLLVRLGVWDHKHVPSEMMIPFANYTRLAELKMLECNLSQPTAFTRFPKSITKLVMENCRFVGGFDWSFLADSGVRELDLVYLESVDGSQLGGALAARLRAKRLDKLRLCYCYFADETLAAVGVELGRIKRLEISGNLNDASIELISLVLQSPNSEMKELALPYEDNTMSHLVPALRHPDWSLAEVSFGGKRAAKTVVDAFRNRLALFVLLQGHQVKRKVLCKLRRLPVEMFRLVGMVLI